MRIVLVHWRDHSSVSPRGRWNQMDEVRDLAPSSGMSIGAVVVDETERLVIAAHFVEGDVGGDLCIPRENIISIRDLGDTEKVNDHA